MQNSLSVYKAVTSTQYNPTQQANIARTNTITASLVIILPIVGVCAIVGYRKYRARALQQQIQYLNQLWQLDSRQKLS